MGEEYTEHKVRVYKATTHKSDGMASKYLIRPMKKLVGKDDSKAKRVSA